ncbi:MAG TPA: hypothetical protein VFU24_07715 [Burkholderiales bacterium]|nr:hypothetical protein [Burkholderiales bacterium]
MKPIAPLPECVTTPGTMPSLRPRPVPALPIACPASAGKAQRYRRPLWREFKKSF